MVKPAAVIFIVSILTITASCGAWAAEGSTGGTFLPLGWDARGQGLAGAAALLVRNEAAAYWNPANLVFLDAMGLSFGSTKPFPEMDNRYSNLCVGTGLLDSRTVPGTDIEVRRFAAALSISHLGLGLAGGSRWNEGTLGLSAAYSINSWNYIGLSWRLMKSWTDLDEANAWGTAVDLGFTTRLGRRMWLALVARNGFSTIHYPHRHEKVDASLVIAASYEKLLDRLSMEFDVILRESELNRMLIGAELEIYEDIFALQGGADIRMVNYSRTIPWFGFSVQYTGARISMSFGFDPEDEFGRQTRFSLGYSF
jgi:hypothetical protein